MKKVFSILCLFFVMEMLLAGNSIVYMSAGQLDAAKQEDLLGRNDAEPYIVVNSTANIDEDGNTVSSGTYPISPIINPGSEDGNGGELTP